jgi:hypothetical protein
MNIFRFSLLMESKSSLFGNGTLFAVLLRAAQSSAHAQ